jgi:LmbE family N-acetylglucosaminyl deacetylase
VSSGNDTAAGRILVVEDDPDTAELLVYMLSRRGGFEVSHAPEPTAALAMSESQTWDMVLTDVQMPGMSGLDLLDELRKRSPDLPVAVITAHASLDNAVRALRSKADEFLTKPVRPDHLITTATALVAKGRAARLARHRSVLAIGAHPDDVEIGAGGTLLSHREMGDEVSVLTLTQGARGGVESARAAEARRAADVLGATLYLEDLSDTRISEGDPTIGAIAKVVEEVRPAIIYTHSLHDLHQDHRNTHRAAMVAAREVARVYCLQSPSATVDFRPTRFVGIDEQLERKLAAIDCYGSQVEIRAYLEPDLIQSTARYWSRYSGSRYSEPFEVIREAAEVSEQPSGEAAHSPVGLPGQRAAGTPATAEVSDAGA